MTETRWCGLAMQHIHKIDNVGNIEFKEVLKKWDSSGHNKYPKKYNFLYKMGPKCF